MNKPVPQWRLFKEERPPISHDEVLIWNGRYMRLARYLDSKLGPWFFDQYDERIKGRVIEWLPITRPSTEKQGVQA